jgi:hypothetical protein
MRAGEFQRRLRGIFWRRPPGGRSLSQIPLSRLAQLWSFLRRRRPDEMRPATAETLRGPLPAGRAFVVLRTRDDDRFGKSRPLEENTFSSTSGIQMNSGRSSIPASGRGRSMVCSFSENIFREDRNHLRQPQSREFRWADHGGESGVGRIAAILFSPPLLSRSPARSPGPFPSRL